MRMSSAELTELVVRFQNNAIIEDEPIFEAINEILQPLAKMNLASTCYRGSREDDLCADFLSKQASRVISGFDPSRGYSFSTYLQVSFRNFSHDWVFSEYSYHGRLLNKDVRELEYELFDQADYMFDVSSTLEELKRFIMMLNRLPGEIEHKILSFHHIRMINGGIFRTTKQDNNQCIHELVGLPFSRICSDLSAIYSRTWFSEHDHISFDCMADMADRLCKKSLLANVFPDGIPNEKIEEIKKLAEKARQWIRDIERLFAKNHSTYMQELYISLKTS